MSTQRSTAFFSSPRLRAKLSETLAGLLLLTLAGCGTSAGPGALPLPAALSGVEAIDPFSETSSAAKAAKARMGSEK